jgi:hypothetical protein
MDRAANSLGYGALVASLRAEGRRIAALGDRHQLALLVKILALAVDRLGRAGDAMNGAIQQVALTAWNSPREVTDEQLSDAGIPSFLDAIGFLVIADMLLDELADISLAAQGKKPGRFPWKDWLAVVESPHEPLDSQIAAAVLRLDLTVHEARNRCVAHVKPGHELLGSWSTQGFQLRVIGPDTRDPVALRAIREVGESLHDLGFGWSESEYHDHLSYANEVVLRASDLTREQRDRLKEAFARLGITVVSMAAIVNDLTLLLRAAVPAVPPRIGPAS